MLRRLYKSNTNIKIDGVCGGIAEYLGMDATIVRLIFLACVFWGPGIIAYIICAVIMPRKSGDSHEGHSGASSGGSQPKAGDYIDYRDKL